MDSSTFNLEPFEGFDGATHGVHAYIQLTPEMISATDTPGNAMLLLAQWEPNEASFRAVLAFKKYLGGTTHMHGKPCEGLISADLVAMWARIPRLHGPRHD